MSHRKLLFGVVLLLVAALVIGGVGCGGGAKPTPTPTATPTAAGTPTAVATPTATTPAGGGVPTWKVGDKWVYNVTYKEVTATFTETVTSADADTYATSIAFASVDRKEKMFVSTALTMDTGMTKKYSVADLDEVEMKATIKTVAAGTLTFVKTGTYTHATSKWPLTVGAEWTGKLKRDVSVTKKEGNIKVVVEKTESVTVPAGTFDCYKLVTTEGTKTILEEWYSADVKSIVKRVENTYWDQPETWELQSYTPK